MTCSFGILYPLWDHAADDGRFLEHVAGEVGLDHVTVPVITGPVVAYRLAVDAEKPYFESVGGWHYRPGGDAYAAAAVRPVKARWQGGGDVLARACEKAKAAGMRVWMRINPRAVAGLVEKEPHLCQRNAWGQEVPSTGACVLNPDLRALLQATLNDLARYEPAGVQVVNWRPDHAADRRNGIAPAWYADGRELLDTCFCASCREVAERAGVDADAAARDVRAKVQKHLSGVGEAPEDAGETVQVYRDARVADCHAWLRRCAEPAGLERRLLTTDSATVDPEACEPWLSMVRLAANQPATDVPADCSALAVPAGRPAFESGQDLVRFLTAASRAGVRMIDFDGLAEMPDEAVTWLRQAVRFARRG